MAATKYSYNKIVNPNKLEREINSSPITIAVDHIDTQGIVVEIWFKASITQEEKDILDNLISLHDNTPIITDVPYDLNNKQIVHETSKPIGTTSTFTSTGDDLSDPTDVGHGGEFTIAHKIGDNSIQSVYADFNIKENPTWIHEGYVIWDQAKFDKVSMEVVPRTTPYSSGVNTNYNIVNGVIIPAAGDGSISINPADIILVEMPIQEHTRKRSSAYWNAVYDANTHTYSNITAAPNGDGRYNIFGEEITFNRFVNNAMFINSGFLMLQTADSAEIGAGMRLKLTIKTVGVDHEWQAACIITLHRMKTC